VVLGLGAVLRLWTALNDHAYHPPIYSRRAEPVPRDQGNRRRAKPPRKSQGEEVRASGLPTVSRRRQPRGRVGRRRAPSDVRGLRARVPLFAFIIELIGHLTGDKRYDALAYEFTKLLSTSFSFTASFGGFLTFLLIMLYPAFTNYLMEVFSPTFLPYVLSSSSKRASSTATTTVGGSFTRSSTSRSASASTWSAR
jgi:hypothetical protein